MARSRARLLAGSLALLLAAPGLRAQSLPRAKPEEVGLSSERLQRLSEAFQGYVKDGKLAGAVVLVARRDAIFRIASQTKALVSVGALRLQEEGRLLTSDPVGKYLPEFQKTKVAVPRQGGGYDVVDAKRPITIRDLLTHTSGISYGSGPAALPFDAQPGERWVYGYSTDVLGAVVEKASGLPLDELLRTRVLEPLKMRDTHFYLPASKTGRLAAVYSAKTEGGIERAPNPGKSVGQGAYVEGPRQSFSGGAGLLSTATDYARFLQMLLNGGELEGVRVLSPKSVELMTADHLGALEFRDGQGFGLGVPW